MSISHHSPYEVNSPFVIAELCGNHMGKVEIAKQLITAAKENGAHCAKFQKRCPKELLTPKQYAAPHPNPKHAFGKTYGQHREKLEFSIDQHVSLSEFCKKVGIEYSTSVWDITSAKQIISAINPKFIKIPSACNNNYKLLDHLYENYNGQIHISLGMTTSDEEGVLRRWIRDDKKAKSRTVLYACTSGYPVPYHKIFLREMIYVASCYSRFAGVGFSGHHVGTAIDIAAYALGAKFIERHFTLDRTWKGTDQSASLEPAELHRLCHDLQAVYDSLKAKPEELDPIELEQRKKLKYRPRR